MNSNIQIQGLQKSYRGVEVLKNLTVEFPLRELTVIVGKSGCGKSTLLRCLDGLEQFDGGEINFGEERITGRLDQKSIKKFRSQFGMVFQSFNLFPHLTVMENMIKAPIIVKKLTKKEAEDIALPLLEKVGLSSHKAHYPNQLSGGQQQRAAIARALALSPRVILYDEPTSALDPWLVEEVFQVMRKLDEEGLTQIIVTHDMRFIRELSKNLVFMDEGHVVDSGTTHEVLTNPRCSRAQHYLTKMNHS